MRCLLLLAVVVAGCGPSVVASPPKVELPKALPAAKPSSSIVYGPSLGTPPSAWQVSVSGGPTTLLTGGQLVRGYREWASPPGPVAYRVEVDPSGRLRFLVIEFGANNGWGAYGPMASMTGIPGSGTWQGRTLDLTPIP